MTDRAPLVETTPQGLWCRAGDFHIDPWAPVDRAVITHAHADHAGRGARRYLTATPGEPVLRHRLGDDAVIESLDYGDATQLNGVHVSLHPAGHLLGSAQVRLEHDGQVCVISGDYKIHTDPTTTAFEPIACDHFITECTFGLPIYCWPDPAGVMTDLNGWWRDNVAAGLTTVIFAYALGKAQRVLADLDPDIGPILLHGAVDGMTQVYRHAGIDLPPTQYADAKVIKQTKGRALVIAPPSANGSPWVRRFKPFASALVSGWMQVRGRRRFRAVDRGFVLSDHADWDGLLDAITATGATRVSTTHGYAEPMARYLREQRGIEADALPTRYGHDEEADEVTEEVTGDP